MSVKNHIPEEELISLLRNKDRNAFEYLYDNYNKALFGIVLKVVNDTPIAEDILQEVFIKIWKNIDQYEMAKGRLFTWMINIARNTAIDKYRSQEFKQQMQNQNLEDSVSDVNSSTSSATKVDHIGLKETISELKPEFVEIIDLLYFKGYTHEELSKEFNIPLGTVKTRIRSAMIELRKKIIKS